MWHARCISIAAARSDRACRRLLGSPAALALALGLAGAAPALAQTGTLQAPAPGTRPPEAPVTPPSAAPRQPVHPATGTAPRPATPAANPPSAPKPPAKPQSPPARDTRAQLPLPLPPPPPPPPPPTDGAPAQSTEKPATPGGKPPGEGPQLPRFASLKSDQVNLRAGPGTRYPIQWVYNRRELPVEIEREFEVWRAIRDPDGVRGWVHQATLTSRRTFIVKGADATVRSDRRDTASAVAIARANVMGRLRACEAGSAWCEVRIGNIKGYLRRDQIWGLLPDEVIKP